IGGSSLQLHRALRKGDALICSCTNSRRLIGKHSDTYIIRGSSAFIIGYCKTEGIATLHRSEERRVGRESRRQGGLRRTSYLRPRIRVNRANCIGGSSLQLHRALRKGDALICSCTNSRRLIGKHSDTYIIRGSSAFIIGYCKTEGIATLH